MSGKVAVDWRIPTKGAAAWNREWESNYSDQWRSTAKGLVPADGFADVATLRVQNLIPNVLAHIEYERSESRGWVLRPEMVILNGVGVSAIIYEPGAPA